MRDVKREWEDGRPRVVIEYEANGEKRSFHFTWHVVTKGRIQVCG